MCEPCIRNHQYNFIKKQARAVLYAYQTVNDLKIIESVRLNAQAKVTELFPDIEESFKATLESIVQVETDGDLQKYLRELDLYVTSFPPITEKQIHKLFPKNKKLKVPKLEQIDLRYTSYLSWTDIATNKMFVVYHDGDKHVGIEGRYTAVNKKGYCFACKSSEDLVLFSAVSKHRPARALPDYYKSVGNYLCSNGVQCNKNITDTSPLERFIHSVL